MSHLLIAVDQRQHGPGGERAEDGLQPDVLGERHEPDQEHESAPHADLGGRVLQPDEDTGEPAPALEARDRQPGQHHEHGEHAEEDQLARGVRRALPREEQRQQDDRAEVRDRGRGDHQLPEVRPDVVGVLEHRDDHAQ